MVRLSYTISHKTGDGNLIIYNYASLIKSYIILIKFYANLKSVFQRKERKASKNSRARGMTLNRS